MVEAVPRKFVHMNRRSDCAARRGTMHPENKEKPGQAGEPGEGLCRQFPKLRVSHSRLGDGSVSSATPRSIKPAGEKQVRVTMILYLLL